MHLVDEVDHPSDLNNRVFKLKIVEIPPSKFKPYGLCWLAGVLSWIKKNGSKIIPLLYGRLSEQGNSAGQALKRAAGPTNMKWVSQIFSSMALLPKINIISSKNHVTE